MSPVLVGAFVLVLGTLLIATVLWLASGGAWRQRVDLYSAIEEESVSGLNLNASVRYNGVEVGSVRAIRLDPANPERVELTFAIKQGTPIRIDTEAMLKTQGLTGIAYVELSGGAPTSALLTTTDAPPYPQIRTVPSLGSRLETVLTTVMVKIDETSQRVDTLLSPANQQAFSQTLADVALLTHTLAASKTQIDAGIRSAALTADRAAVASAQLAPVLARIGRSADALEAFGTEARQVGVKAGRSLDGVDEGAQAVVTQTLPDLRRLLGELTVLSTSLRHLSEQAERSPAGLLRGRGRTPDGPGEGPNTDAATGPRP